MGKVDKIYEQIEAYRDAVHGINELNYIWNTLNSEDIDKLSIVYKEPGFVKTTMTVNVFKVNLIRDILIASQSQYEVYKERYENEKIKAIVELEYALHLSKSEVIEFLERQLDE